jgi:hypothetical protein
MELTTIVGVGINKLVPPEFQEPIQLILTIFVGLSVLKGILTILQSEQFVRLYILLTPVKNLLVEKFVDLNNSPLEKAEGYKKFSSLIDVVLFYPMTVLMALISIFSAWVSFYALKSEVGYGIIIGSIFMTMCSALMSRFCKVAGDKGLHEYRHVK